MSPKIMFLQGVKHPMSYNGVGYANDPQTEGVGGGGALAPAPALDITTHVSSR